MLHVLPFGFEASFKIGVDGDVIARHSGKELDLRRIREMLRVIKFVFCDLVLNAGFQSFTTLDVLIGRLKLDTLTTPHVAVIKIHGSKPQS